MRALQTLTLQPPAKINLLLYVLDRRPDGYHRILSLMQMVDLRDGLTLVRRPASEGIRLSALGRSIPAGGENLAVRAARAWMDRYGIESGLRIRLVKKIPVGAGLGGGSGNAAAVLAGLCRMFGLKPSREELAALAQSIGSDVPFFLNGPTAWVSGTGEAVAPAALTEAGWVVLVNPGFEVSTARIYAEYDRAPPPRDPERGAFLEKIGLTLDPEHLRISDRRVKAFPLLKRSFSLQNDLEVITIRRHPVIAAIKERLLFLGAGEALMSGSGPTVFGLFADSVSARRAAVRFRRGGMKPGGVDRTWTIRVARLLRRPPWSIR